MNRWCSSECAVEWPFVWNLLQTLKTTSDIEKLPQTAFFFLLAHKSVCDTFFCFVIKKMPQGRSVSRWNQRIPRVKVTSVKNMRALGNYISCFFFQLFDLTFYTIRFPTTSINTSFLVAHRIHGKLRVSFFLFVFLSYIKLILNLY